MPEQFYLIPQSDPPWSITNKHRPVALDGIVCNYICKDVPAFSAFLVKVNTTEANHAVIAARPNVRQLPAGLTWETVISTMSTPQRNFISNLCGQLGIPYDDTETLGELLNRIVFSADLSLGSASVTTQYNTLTVGQQNALNNFCAKWQKQNPGSNETIKGLVARLAKTMWDGSKPIPEVT